ncbi:MAG TPA: hypothetical protein VFC63_04065 [Blastocatellia bacterium]|nr:hypothetical protein [Blastocatellia bacterium]
MSLTLIIVLFVIAALGGFGLLSFHLRGKQLPGALAVIHGLVAAVALILLIVFAVNH